MKGSLTVHLNFNVKRSKFNFLKEKLKRNVDISVLENS